MNKPQSTNIGFTLIELMVTISVAAVLIALAVPNFTPVIRSNRFSTYSNNLIAALNLARSEAVKRGQEVVIRKIGANWEGGWTIFVDIDRSTAGTNPITDNIYNATAATDCTAGADCLLKTYPALANAYTLRGGGNLKDFIRYTSSGISNYLPDNLIQKNNIDKDYFVICDNSDGNNTPEANTAKLIVMNTVGRPRLALDTTTPADNIPNLNLTTNVTTCTPP
jgi:type IV fimbrial biogenesis protein FimT